MVGLVLCLFSIQVSADKPAPPAVDKFQSGTSAFDAGHYAKARELWLPLAEAGDVRAQYAIGRLYEKGKGVERNFAQAFVWYRKAAEKGHADSEYRLAVGYAYGLGIQKDEGEALSWLRKAAN
ncbi:MAG: sel1 repeat family protein, partial [Gammaproteobacteria bacterium]|nr:sel1 repeat family protein [Gammaproteobacteria bacterium]